jgi:hypothetical protein
MNFQVFGRPGIDGSYTNGGGPDGNTSLATSFTDGTSQTILFAEKYARCGSYGNLWDYPLPGSAWFPAFAMLPGYVGPVTTTQTSLFQYRPNPWLRMCDHARASTGHDGGISVCLADGSARTVSPVVGAAIWWAACTPHGEDFLGPQW